MRFLLFSVLILFGSVFVFPQNQSVSYETESFRRIQDKNFRDEKLSPLLPSDFAKFDGLKYFGFDENYRIKASLILSAETKSILMPTSTGSSRKYLKIGDLSFRLNGKDFSLGAYQMEYPPNYPKENVIKDLFVPFKDLTNGEETYSGGRYLYIREPLVKDEFWILDFNLAHNPNCAYNPNFACTLPPKENFLQVEIKAGEKKFKSANEDSAH